MSENRIAKILPIFRSKQTVLKVQITLVSADDVVQQHPLIGTPTDPHLSVGKVSIDTVKSGHCPIPVPNLQHKVSFSDKPE
jgi:hypothetical protein